MLFCFLFSLKHQFGSLATTSFFLMYQSNLKCIVIFLLVLSWLWVVIDTVKCSWNIKSLESSVLTLAMFVVAAVIRHAFLISSGSSRTAPALLWLPWDNMGLQCLANLMNFPLEITSPLFFPNKNIFSELSLYHTFLMSKPYSKLI